MMRSPEPQMNAARAVFRLAATVCLLFFLAPNLPASTQKAERRLFQRSIVDYRKNLNAKFQKIRRKKTKYIIVHTSEAGLKSTLRAVSKGKRIPKKWRTRGGHTHYVIARDGTTYRVLDKKYRADHAGKSMWNGERRLSNLSLGVELVGYHYADVTDRQYRSLGLLIDILQDVYDLDDRAVLTHSQIAYGGPNRWFRKSHRGRKRCAKNFDRRKAGCNGGWDHDPDVRNGRLSADRELARIFYGNGRRKRAGTVAVASRGTGPATTPSTNIISRSNSAWNIAGEDYNAPTTLYRLPSGRTIAGDRIASTIGWNRLPRNTHVLINQEDGLKAVAKPDRIVKTLSNGMNAWAYAGPAYRAKTTIYLFPNGRIKNGREISDWDGLPPQTRMLVGYNGPYRVTRRQPPVRIAGKRFRDDKTLYLMPNRKLKPGNEIRDFKKLPRGTKLFVPSRPS